MKRTLVRYKTRPERTEENARLIENVFEELREKSPQTVRYLALKLDDGTFVHFTTVETADSANPLMELAAFRAFQAGIKDRCVELPKSGAATVIGAYRVLDER